MRSRKKPSDTPMTSSRTEYYCHYECMMLYILLSLLYLIHWRRARTCGREKWQAAETYIFFLNSKYFDLPSFFFFFLLLQQLQLHESTCWRISDNGNNNFQQHVVRKRWVNGTSAQTRDLWTLVQFPSSAVNFLVFCWDFPCLFCAFRLGEWTSSNVDDRHWTEKGLGETPDIKSITCF